MKAPRDLDARRCEAKRLRDDLGVLVLRAKRANDREALHNLAAYAAVLDSLESALDHLADDGDDGLPAGAVLVAPGEA